MASINYYICNNCQFTVSLSIKGERERMLKNHDGIARKELLCSACGEVSVFYANTEKKCPKCECDQLVGLNSNKCPKCKLGLMEEDDKNAVCF